MANAYVGNPYALVFPVDCDGFLKIPYSRNAGVGTFTANTTNTSTTLSNVSAFTGLDVGMPITGTGIPDNTTIRSLDTSANTMTISNAATATATGVTISFGSHTNITETDLWSHGAGFTVEAVITPYDVNGNGQTGKGKTLEITGPSGSYANGISNRYAQKMMLFSNTSFQFYLENQTSSNVNQPAEYRLAAKVGSTTLNSPTVIKPVSTLHGYYDADGFYNGMRTSLTKIDSNASLSLEQGSVEITGNLTSLANDKATGSLTLGSIPSGELYTAGTKRTVDITMAGLPSIADGTLDSTATAASGSITMGAAPYELDLSLDSETEPNHADNTYAIKITSDTTDFFFYAVSGVSIANGARLNSSYSGLGYGTGDIAYNHSSNTTTAASNLHAAINALQAASNSGFDIQSALVSNALNLNADTTGPAYNDTIVRGSNLSSSIAVTGLSGGANAAVVEQYLTITMKTGSSTTVTKRFKYFTGSASDNGTTTTTPANVTVHKVIIDSDTDGTATRLISAINTAFNTTTEASASKPSTNVVRVEQQYVGSGFGSGSSVSETSAYNSDTLHTIGSFTSGVQGSDTSYNKFIKIGTNFFSPCDDASLAGTTKTITGDSGSATSRLFLGDSTLANNVNSLVAQINTDVSSNGSSIITGSNTSTGVISFELNDFTTALTLTENLTNVTETGISGGQNLTAFISITDAAGVERKYKPAVDENTAATDGTYVFFEASSDTAATAAQLELAIESANGHNGSLTVNRSNSTLTLTVTTTGTSETMSLDNTNITSSNVTLTAFAGAPNTVTVSQSQTGLLGAGNKIYDSSGTFIDTVASVNGTQITLSNAQSSITSTIYKEQPKEAFYVNSLYKVSCVLEKSGRLRLFLNNAMIAETVVPNFSFDMTNEDCFIAQDGTNVSTQFMGELYEITMKKGAQPSASIHTLEPGYSDIIFYYRFGDE